MTPYEALLKAKKIAGNQEKLGLICGVSQAAVSQWELAKKVPVAHVLKVEAATGVSRYKLRPDIYPPELFDKKAS